MHDSSDRSPDRPPATVAQRVYGLLIDAVVQVTVISTLPAVLQALGTPETLRASVFAAVCFLTLCAYDPLLVHFTGRTIGHRVQGIEVIAADGGRVSLGVAYVRFLIKTVLGVWSMLTMMGRRQLAVQDMATRSRVVRADDR
jgi:uncharacterized RDD family membrane protein YckC